MRIVIVDDEPLARERLVSLVNAIEGCEVCGVAENGIQAITQLEQCLPDILLMDIRMPGMDGLEAARHIATLETPPAIIFTTAYEEYAIKAFEAHAVGYLLKPVRVEHLQTALQAAQRINRMQIHAIHQASGEAIARAHLCIQQPGRTHLIAVEDIFYFQAQQKYITVCHRSGEALLEEPLKHLEQEFSAQFLRVHRNALAAKRHLIGIKKTPQGHFEAVFKGCHQPLEISRRHVAAVRHFMDAVASERPSY